MAHSLHDLTPKSSKILLINAHARDIRLPWATRHQPTGLLQIGTALKNDLGCDVRFLDCLGWTPRKQPKRRKVGEITLEGQLLDLWQFGVDWSEISALIREWKSEGWTPDQVYVSCFQAHWWQAASDGIAQIKKLFPQAQVLLGGVYPTIYEEHAKANSGAHLVLAGSIIEARSQIPDLTLYPNDRRPGFAGIYLFHSQNVADVETERILMPRPADEIAREVLEKAKQGVTEFAFFDESINENSRTDFIRTLRAIAALDLRKVRFVGLGNISPNVIDNEVAKWMGKAYYKQIHFQYDVEHTPNGTIPLTTYDEYLNAVQALYQKAEFKPRHGDITAMLLTGTPYEDIEAVTERLIYISSIVGSVNLVQYQYTPNTAAGNVHSAIIDQWNSIADPILLNCKLYPFAQALGIPFSSYSELTRLASLLNSKYRDKTFDFLSDSLTAQLIRRSLRTEQWRPFQSPNLDEVIPLIPVTNKADK